jgi:aspartyl-tRNA synthetase
MHMSNRIVSLRSPTSQSIFRISSSVTSLFRSYLSSPPSTAYLLHRREHPQQQHHQRTHSKPFVEIHTPKLLPSATEGGAAVFAVQYFGRKAFLAQSPQFSKQMCVAADFERVFEVGPGESHRLGAPRKVVWKID